MFNEAKYKILEACLEGASSILEELYLAVEKYDWNVPVSRRQRWTKPAHPAPSLSRRHSRMDPNYTILSLLSEAERIPLDPNDAGEVRYCINNFKKAKSILLSYDLDRHIRKLLNDVSKLFDAYSYVRNLVGRRYPAESERVN